MERDTFDDDAVDTAADVAAAGDDEVADGDDDDESAVDVAVPNADGEHPPLPPPPPVPPPVEPSKFVDVDDNEL